MFCIAISVIFFSSNGNVSDVSLYSNFVRGEHEKSPQAPVKGFIVDWGIGSRASMKGIPTTPATLKVT